MKLSIFPKCKALPSSKEEKQKYARFTSRPHLPEIVEIRNENDLIDIVTKYSWSPFVFEDFRRQDGFISTDFAVFDIDDGMRIEDAESIIDELSVACLCMPSTSHTPEHHRFRLVFPLSKSIQNKDEYKETMMKLGEYFQYDPSCLTDTARFYYGSTDDDGFWIEGDLYTPVRPKPKLSESFDKSSYTDTIEVGEDVVDVVRALYGEDKEKIPEQVDFFIREAHTGLLGNWHNASNSFIFTLGLQGVSFERVAAVYEELAPEPLDNHDEYLLERAYNDANLKRKELERDDKKEKRRSRRRNRSR